MGINLCQYCSLEYLRLFCLTIFIVIIIIILQRLYNYELNVLVIVFTHLSFYIYIGYVFLLPFSKTDKNTKTKPDKSSDKLEKQDSFPATVSAGVVTKRTSSLVEKVYLAMLFVRLLHFSLFRLLYIFQ